MTFDWTIARGRASRAARALLMGWTILPIALGAVAGGAAVAADRYDLVIANGRVMDPETGLDAVRNVGIRNGSIEAVSEVPLDGARTVDATGLVVAPGFINLHWHGTDPHSNTWEAMDGVTSTFELEIGVADVDQWYDERAGRMPINYGVAVGHVPVRMAVLNDPGEFVPSGEAARRPATEAEIAEIAKRIEHGLKRGAVGVGFGLAYTPAASHWEITQMFRVAAAHDAAAYVHIRGASSAGSPDREQGLLEAVAHSAVTGAPVHIAHINSSAQQNAARMLGIIAEARRNGVDITTECYPYAAGMTRLESFLFDAWVDKPEEEYRKLQWVETGERLTKETFARYRKQGGYVIIHSNTEEVVRTAVTHPLTMFASDGFDVHERQAHPRSAGTYSRVLGRYVREQGALSLMDALRKMTLMPAQRLEGRVPEMRRKGRLQAGADADIAVFDPRTIIDRATYEAPSLYAEGMRHVLVGGVFVIEGGRLIDGAVPGKPVRGAVQP